MESKIRDLKIQLRHELEYRKVTVDDVLDELTFLPMELKGEYEDCITKEMKKSKRYRSVRQLFQVLINPLTTFLDYKLIHHLISVFGGSQLKQDMADYINKVSDFKKKRTVAELMDHWNGVEDKSVNFKELEVRFGEDPTKCTLERLDKHRKRFCGRYKLSELIMILIFLKPGSYSAVWQIPNVLFGVDKESAIQTDHAFVAEERIISVIIAGKQIYPGTCTCYTANITCHCLMTYSMGQRKVNRYCIHAVCICGHTIASVEEEGFDISPAYLFFLFSRNPREHEYSNLWPQVCSHKSHMHSFTSVYPCECYIICATCSIIARHKRMHLDNITCACGHGVVRIYCITHKCDVDKIAFQPNS